MTLKKYLLMTNVSGELEKLYETDNRDTIFEKFNLWSHILPKCSLSVFINAKYLNKYLRVNNNILLFKEEK